MRLRLPNRRYPDGSPICAGLHRLPRRLSDLPFVQAELPRRRHYADAGQGREADGIMGVANLVCHVVN